jgi:hypothetical protein
MLTDASNRLAPYGVAALRAGAALWNDRK